jgi:[ribosomal protein S18]-alanine N-acetyltransferase
MTEFLIRGFGRGEAGLIAVLQACCFPDDPWDVQEILSVLSMPGAFGLLAVAANEAQPIGFVLALDLGEECEIILLGVLPPCRGRGIGRAILASLVERQRHNPGGLVLEVAEDNLPALRLYEKTGFVRIGKRKGYYARPGHPPMSALVLRRIGPDR